MKSPRVLVAALALPVLAHAADFRSTRDPATVMYDAPSARAKPLFVYGRDVPVESPASAHATIGVDLPASEARDDQVAAEAAEPGRRERDPPRLVEVAEHAAEQAPVR